MYLAEENAKMIKSSTKIKFTLWLITLFSFCTFPGSYANQFCNGFVDVVLDKVKKDSEYFQEPYEIPDSQKSFGIYNLEFGFIYGLNTLHRNEDVIVNKRDGKPYLKVTLSAGEIDIRAHVKRKFLSVRNSANVDAKIGLITMEFDITPNIDGSNPTITDFRVIEVKLMNVKVSGTGKVREFLLNAFLSAFGRYFTGVVKNTIESKLTAFFIDKRLEFTVPLVCLSGAWK